MGPLLEGITEEEYDYSSSLVEEVLGAKVPQGIMQVRTIYLMKVRRSLERKTGKKYSINYDEAGVALTDLKSQKRVIYSHLEDATSFLSNSKEAKDSLVEHSPPYQEELFLSGSKDTSDISIMMFENDELKGVYQIPYKIIRS